MIDDSTKRRRLPKAQVCMVFSLLLAVGLASIDAPFPEVAMFHHVPTVLLALVAPLLLRRWPLSNKAAGCVTLFMILHTIGGRYTYLYVPYDEWATTLTGHSISSKFGFTRNHYDRLVHLVFGLCIAPVVYEVLQEYSGIGRRLAVYLSVELVFATSAFYEIFEWMLTLVAASATADSYNGQQGDIWDAQRDMAIAAIGALLFASWTVFRWPKTEVD